MLIETTNVSLFIFCCLLNEFQFLPVYDSLNLTHRRVLEDIYNFFASVLPVGKRWEVSVPENLQIQDDIASCGVNVMFYSYAISTDGAVPACSPSSRKMRNFILKELKGACKITVGADKSKCVICKKVVKVTERSCKKCESSVHKICAAKLSKADSFVCFE